LWRSDWRIEWRALKERPNFVVEASEDEQESRALNAETLSSLRKDLRKTEKENSLRPEYGYVE